MTANVIHRRLAALFLVACFLMRMGLGLSHEGQHHAALAHGSAALTHAGSELPGAEKAVDADHCAFCQMLQSSFTQGLSAPIMELSARAQPLYYPPVLAAMLQQTPSFFSLRAPPL